MPYRSSDSKERRRRELAAELTRARELTDPAARRAAEAQVLSALRDLGLPRQKRSLPTFSLLPRLRIASPCTESWDAMEGDERVRHCSKCERDVFHLSAMTRAEVEALLAAHQALPEEGLPCVRFYRRSDGTILTADCPVGAPRKHALQLAATAAVAITALVTATAGTPPAPHRTGPPPPPPVRPPEGSVHIDADWGTHWNEALAARLAADEAMGAGAYFAGGMGGMVLSSPTSDPVSAVALEGLEADPPSPSRRARASMADDGTVILTTRPSRPRGARRARR